MAIDGGLRQLFRARLPKFFWTAVETPGTGGGVPDHFWAYNGVMGWNEYKQTKGWAVKFRPFQVPWHESLARQGGRSFVIVRRQNQISDELYIYRGADARRVQDDGIKDFRPILLQVAKWDWGKIAATLTNGEDA